METREQNWSDVPAWMGTPGGACTLSPSRAGAQLAQTASLQVLFHLYVEFSMYFTMWAKLRNSIAHKMLTQDLHTYYQPLYVSHC